MCCKQKNGYKAEFYSGNKKILVENGNFFITHKGSPYFYINNTQITDKVSNMAIDSIEFSLGKNIYTAKPVRLMFSNRGSELSDFLFPVSNDSKEIVFDTFGNRKMFTLVSNKTELTKLVKVESIIKDK